MYELLDKKIVIMVLHAWLKYVIIFVQGSKDSENLIVHAL